MTVLNSLKRAMLELLLERSTPWVSIDTTFAGIDLPPHLRDQGIINFRLVSDGVRLPDLKLTDEGWGATLCFQGGRIYRARVPWGACVQFSDSPTQHTYVVVFGTEKPTIKDLPPVKPKLVLIKEEGD